MLPNGLNVYPEDIENALRVAGVRDSVVLETAPGRIEAVVLALADESDEVMKERVDAAVKTANASLGPNQSARPRPITIVPCDCTHRSDRTKPLSDSTVARWVRNVKGSRSTAGTSPPPGRCGARARSGGARWASTRL